MAAGNRNVGLGIFLILLGVFGAVRWQTADLHGDAETAGYFAVSVVLFVLGLWLIFRRSGQRP